MVRIEPFRWRIRHYSHWRRRLIFSQRNQTAHSNIWRCDSDRKPFTLFCFQRSFQLRRVFRSGYIKDPHVAGCEPVQSNLLASSDREAQVVLITDVRMRIRNLNSIDKTHIARTELRGQTHNVVALSQDPACQLKCLYALILTIKCNLSNIHMVDLHRDSMGQLRDALQADLASRGL